jgi:autotransporter-associated beta strand protein
LAVCSGVAAGLVSLGNAGAAIVYSGQKNIGITNDFEGVFINVTALQSTTAANGSWDLNPFFGGLGIANSPGFQPVRSGTGNEDPILALALGTSVSSSVNFSSDWGGSGAEDDSGHLGPAAGQFTAGQTGYLGFKLLRGTAVNYGWMRVNLTRNGATGSILDWAYDDSGSSILTGTVADLGATPVVRKAGTEQTLSSSQAGTGLLMEEGAKITFNEGTQGGSYAGKIHGAGEIKIAGAGGLRLAGTNTFSGTASVQDGSRLTVGEAGNLGSAQIKIGSAGSLEFDSLAVNNGSANTFANAISLDGQAATLNNSGSGKVVLSGSIASNGGLLGFTGGSFDVQGGITGAGSLRKEGTGTLTLSGANTYTGNTIVSGGALAINGSVSGASNVIVETGGTLKGSGSIGGSLDISGSLAVGNSPGVLTSSGTTNFNSSSMFEWEIDTSQSNPESNRGVAYDGLNTTALTGSGAVFKILLTGTEDFADPFWSQDRVWTDIFKSVDGSSSLSDWSSVFSGGFQYSYNGQSVAPTSHGSFTVSGSSLNWSAVPEPSNAVLGLVAASVLLRRRRNQV